MTRYYGESDPADLAAPIDIPLPHDKPRYVIVVDCDDDTEVFTLTRVKRGVERDLEPDVEHTVTPLAAKQVEIIGATTLRCTPANGTSAAKIRIQG